MATPIELIDTMPKGRKPKNDQSERSSENSVTDKLQSEIEEEAANRKRKKSRISLAFRSSRTCIARATAGKIGAEFLIAPVLFGLGIHILMFVLGIKYSSKCNSKQLVPVSMVLLGGDGLLKCLSYLLQVVIVIQTKMSREASVRFLSESSVLDNGLNLSYVCAIFLAVAAVFAGGNPLCQLVIFDFIYYYTIVMICVVGLILLLLIWKLYKPDLDEDED